MEMKKLPKSIQSFRQLRERNCIYVDKTEQVHQFVSNGYTYFFSRPRRFRKSLLVSKFAELYSGSKELFESIWIYDHWDWSKKYPIIHILFATISYAALGLDKGLEIEIKNIAASFNNELTQGDFKSNFKELLNKILKTKGKFVLLIDEYDKPIIDYLENDKLVQAKANQTILRQFYSVLKDAGDKIQFFFITGVSKFAKVSIFSDLNHLNDISMNAKYATLTGYTQQELEFSFEDYIQAVQKLLGITQEA